MTIVYCKNCGCQVVGEVSAAPGKVWECDECSPNPSPSYRRGEARSTNQEGSRRVYSRALRPSTVLLILGVSALLIHTLAGGDLAAFSVEPSASAAPAAPAVSQPNDVNSRVAQSSVDARKTPLCR